MAVALAITAATWGPMLLVLFGTGAPAWERFVDRASAPYCHQLPARSFHLAAHVFPLCTRCTGMWIGITLGVAFAMLVVPKRRWAVGSLLALAATAASAADRLREDLYLASYGWLRFALGLLIFAGVTLAVSFDTLAMLLALLRAIARIPRYLARSD